MKKEKNDNLEKKKKSVTKKKNVDEKKVSKSQKLEEIKLKKNRKNFLIFFMIWICIFASGLVAKVLQNDTFYTIKIGELILDNGIDMMDHFSFHVNLPYTYPHWLYDVFIYLCYKIGGFTGIYISSIVLFLGLILLVFKINRLITNNNYTISAFSTFICTLAIGGFATARAQLVSFVIFALEIYFIERFLESKNKKFLLGLLALSILVCNVHLAVWPFYFILYLPYLAEYVISFIVSKIKLKKENKFVKFLKSKFVLEKNSNIKYLFLTMLLCLFTGLLTPLGDTPYTYTFNMMKSNAQEYVKEHQMLTWKDSPFTIIILFETVFLSMFSKIKLRDCFMIAGLALMSIISIRHISLLALIGTICFARLFSMFVDNYEFYIDNKVVNFFCKKKVMVISYILVIIFSGVLFSMNLSKDFVDDELYPVEAVKYIKENLNVNEMRIFNEYDFGSYLLLHDIPVFVDSRADLYTSPYSGLDYDILDDYHYMASHYQKDFEFYGITHALIYKKYEDRETPFYNMLKNDSNYSVLYEDEHFILYEKIGMDIIITYN